DAYLEAMAAIARGRLDCYLSIKAPALGGSGELFAEVVGTSRRTGVPLHFDALGPEDAGTALALAARAMPHAPGLGCTLPARGGRSAAAADAAAAMGLSVRLVKGERPDPGAPGADPCGGFLALAERLAGRARHVAVATHDLELARQALARLIASGT